jgi:parallel beta-helix repeat protein
MRISMTAVLATFTFHIVALADEDLPVPTNIRDSDTVQLACGRTYVGELRLAGLRNVTVRTAGACGKAVLTTAHQVSGWRREPRHPSIWVADWDIRPAQIQLDDVFIPPAHHPNTPQRWLRGESRHPGQLQASLPSRDLAGATLVWRAADWLIQSRTIAATDGKTLMLSSGDDEGFGLLPQTEFYLEGKRWMLDAPGEWVWEDGRLYLWPPDGGSPEGRARASARARAIDASGSRDIRIDGLRIIGATLGIDGTDSRRLIIHNTVIENSGEEAVLAGSGTRIRRLQVKGSVQNGVRANDDVRDVAISDSRFDGIGMLGMPRRSKGAIVFEQARNVIVQRNRISNSAYIGIRVFRDAMVSDNVITHACLRLADCGGIYTFARDRQRLNVRIERNQISKLAGRNAYAIYLDDFANGVTVTANRLVDNPGGIELHNGFDNEISGNHFVNSRYEHMLFNETAPFASITGNRVHRNRFSGAANVPVYRLWSHHGGVHLARFAVFSDNRYLKPPQPFAELEGRGMLNIERWREQIGDDDGTRAAVAGSAARTSPKLARQREKE